MMILRLPYLSLNPIWHNGATIGTFAGITGLAVLILVVHCLFGKDYSKPTAPKSKSKSSSNDSTLSGAAVVMARLESGQNATGTKKPRKKRDNITQSTSSTHRKGGKGSSSSSNQETHDLGKHEYYLWIFPAIALGIDFRLSI